jgi:hypothetical protein
MRLPLLLAGAAFILASFQSSTAQKSACPALTQAVSICVVAADAARYDGKEVIVHGAYRMEIHGSVLMEDACPEAKVNLKEAPDYKADKRAQRNLRELTKKNQSQPVWVVLRGTFHAAREGQCFGQNCEPYQIDSHELLCAERPEPSGNGTVPHQ